MVRARDAVTLCIVGYVVLDVDFSRKYGPFPPAVLLNAAVMLFGATHGMDKVVSVHNPHPVAVSDGVCMYLHCSFLSANGPLSASMVK
jgi:hypothetical protein